MAVWVQVLSLNDFKRNQLASGRIKDLADVANLPGGPPSIE